MRSRALALIVAFGSLSLVACGGGDDDAADETTTTEEATTTTADKKDTTTTTEETTTTEGSGDLAAGLITPGTELALGQPAQVLYTTDAGDEATLEVTVTAIEKGDPADMAGFDLGEDAGKTPWYVRVTVTNTSDVDLSDEYITLGLEANDDRNEQLGALILVGDFSKCENDYAPAGFVKGETFEACEPYLVHPEGGVSSAFWNELGTPYFDAPVVWKAS
jgi:hypothetical protein